MQNEVDIKAKIKELKAVGSPSALSKARELEWVLGIEDAPDEEADMLTDLLLKGAGTKESGGLWDRLPAFVRNHVTYSFDKEYDRFKELDRKGSMTDEEDTEWQLLYKKVKEKADAYYDARAKRIAALGKKEQDKLEEEAYEGSRYIRIPDVQEDISKAELISSLTPSGKHRPLLDLDIAAAIIPSSTKGHGHLYIDKELTWKQYIKLLNVLADLEIIEPGYRGASIARGYTALRLPWVKKTAKERELDKKKKAAAEKRKAEKEDARKAEEDMKKPLLHAAP